jgi:hypothetical protein
VDVETLFEMAAAAARNAERMCSTVSTTTLFYEGYGGYPAYAAEYNRLAKLAAELLGAEAQDLFPQMDLGTAWNPSGTRGIMWKTYAEFAAARLSALAAYLKTKGGRKPREQDEIISLIEANLRPAIFVDPENERQVQNALETIFRARGLEFRRETETVPYSSKRYVPDFTFANLGLAVEVKLCGRASREKDMIDEVNADIVGYRGAYERVVFVIYDLGFIRDIETFCSGIEDQPGVQVCVIKK